MYVYLYLYLYLSIDLSIYRSIYIYIYRYRYIYGLRHTGLTGGPWAARRVEFSRTYQRGKPAH